MSGAGINLEGHAEMEGVVHVLTTDPEGDAGGARERRGSEWSESSRSSWCEVDDRPGSAASIFRRIADAKVNIRFSYLATRNRLVIAADDLQDLLTALAD